MRWKLVVVVTAGLLIAADKADSNKAQDKLKGSWKLVSAELGGEKVDLTKDKDLPSKLTFDGDKFTAVYKGEKHEASYKLGSGKKANAIDIISSEGKDKGKVVIKAIYHLKGDTLKICVNRKKNTERPKELASKEGTQLAVLVFQRIKDE
jgi:uncharacterized protein (TIGR03067 family)